MIITRTPFRISFFGGGTDYPIWYKQNGGAVISAAIDKYCYITTRFLPPFFDYKYRIRYTDRELVKKISQIKHPSVRECLKFFNIDEGLEVVHTSDLPAMSGLGSSSSFTVGLLNSLYGYKGKKMPPKKLAEDAIMVEQELIKESVGSQDQIIAAFGGFNKISFNKDKTFKVQPLQISDFKIKQLEENLLLYFTGFQRYASDVAKSWIKNTPKKETELQEMGKLVIDAQKILESKNNNLDDFGRLLDYNWNLKKSISNKISNGSIDQIYNAAMESGALGGKLLGAGSGGFILFYVNPENKEKVKRKLRKLLYVPFKFEQRGSLIIYNMPESFKNDYK